MDIETHTCILKVNATILARSCLYSEDSAVNTAAKGYTPPQPIPRMNRQTIWHGKFEYNVRIRKQMGAVYLLKGSHQY